jgi:hypothetical protein
MRYAFILGALFAATTANAQWEIQPAPTTADLRGIDNVGKGIVWASGSDGTVLRTTDDGAHWQLCPTPPDAEKLDFRGIQAFDANTAIVMSTGKGPLSRLYKTTDGCQTWKLVFTNPDPEGSWDTMQFYAPRFDLLGHRWDYSRSSGLVAGDPINGSFVIFQTFDGGNTWIRRQPRRRVGGDCKIDGVPAEYGEALFAAGNQSLVNFGGIPNFLIVSGGKVARLLYTNESSWDGSFCHLSASTVGLPLASGNASTGAFAIAATNANSYFPLRLMIVGGDYTKPEQAAGNAVFVASKAGFHLPFTSYFNVSTPQTPPHGFRSAVAYDEAAKTWITVGPNGTDISTDDGRNWRALRPTPNEPADADRDWNALSLPFVVGPHGRIGKLRPEALAPPKTPSSTRRKGTPKGASRRKISLQSIR